MDTSRIALDANLMLAVDARRFLCAMQEMTGGHIWAFRHLARQSRQAARPARECGKPVDYGIASNAAVAVSTTKRALAKARFASSSM